MHERLRSCGNTQIEYVLSQACLGFSRVTHLLRTSGAIYEQEERALQEFDAVLNSTLERIAPGLDEAGLSQAELCVSAGGLGWRHAKSIALPANVAGRVAARPKIKELAHAMDTAGLLPATSFLNHFD
eukprot:3157984-Karenia_brevis.AAC.1